jgi:hypothetical protein
MRGLVFHNATPELFRRHLHEAIERVADRKPGEAIVFLKAWNEWAEGNYVEPDQKWGRAWLEVIHDEITKPAASGELNAGVFGDNYPVRSATTILTG